MLMELCNLCVVVVGVTESVGRKINWHELLHLAHGLLEADHDGPRHDAVPDIELVHVRNIGDGPRVLVIQAVAGVVRHSRGDDLLRGDRELHEFLCRGLAGFAKA